MRIVFSPDARRDLRAAVEYLVRANPRAALRLVERLDRALSLLADGAVEGPLVRLRRGGQARRWSTPPFRLYYRRTDDELVVLRFYHGARRPLEQ
jgi:plasmid stabilization system protein ParE